MLSSLKGNASMYSRPAKNRDGIVLIVVVGLAMVLLSIAVSFLIRMRSDSQEVQAVTATAQSRIMLSAALMYLQEGSRLGWATGGSPLTRGTETFGWTDVRDGSLGPRQNRNYPNKTKYNGASTSSPVDSTIDGVFNGPVPVLGYNIPVPSWWDLGWPQYRAIPDDNDPSQFPTSSIRHWPCPGSVVRCPMAVPVQPPFATQLRFSYNAVNPPPTAPGYGQPGFDTAWQTAATRVNQYSSPPNQPVYVDWPRTWLDNIFNINAGSTGMLDPQPQATKWEDPAYTGAPGQIPDFISGAIQPGVTTGDWTHYVDNGVLPPRAVQLAIQDGTDNICWFRIYREVQADHDNDGVPAYDRVALYDPNNAILKNWNVFVIACGYGATRGYRFWDAADISAWETNNGYPINTVTRGQDFASSSPLFQSMGEAGFKNLLLSSKVLWYRVEWTALQGGGFVPEHYSWGGMNRNMNASDAGLSTATGQGPVELGPNPPTPFPGWNYPNNLGFNPGAIETNQMEGGYSNEEIRYSAIKSYGGNFKWVQALDREPPNW
jgi:hypothetical protein